MEALPARGPALHRTAFHSHHAIQVTLSLGGQFELRTNNITAACDAVIAPDVEHLLEASGHVAILFVDPECRAGRAIIKAILKGADLEPVPEGLLDDLAGQLRDAWHQSSTDESALQGIAHRVIARLAGAISGNMPDVRVRKMMEHVALRLDGAISLNSAAEAAGLSPSRARHLFVEQTGLPFRSYLLWLRITKAVRIMSAGSSLTEAAHEAGFAEFCPFQPHLPAHVRDSGSLSSNNIALSFKCRGMPSRRNGAFKPQPWRHQ